MCAAFDGKFTNLHWRAWALTGFLDTINKAWQPSPRGWAFVPAAEVTSTAYLAWWSTGEQRQDGRDSQVCKQIMANSTLLATDAKVDAAAGLTKYVIATSVGPGLTPAASRNVQPVPAPIPALRPAPDLAAMPPSADKSASLAKSAENLAMRKEVYRTLQAETTDMSSSSHCSSTAKATTQRAPKDMQESHSGCAPPTVPGRSPSKMLT